MTERACAEFVIVNGVKVVCGEPESAHTPEAARLDVGMDHNFVLANMGRGRVKDNFTNYLRNETRLGCLFTVLLVVALILAAVLLK